MQAVRDVGQFTALIKEVRAKGGGLLTNWFFFLGDVERYTQQRNLFWVAHPSGVLFYKEETDLLNLYYYFAADLLQPAALQKLQKPVVLDLVSAGVEPDLAVQRMYTYWMSNGFVLYKTYRRMVLEIKEPTIAAESSALLPVGYRFGFARVEHLAEIQSLWRSSLDSLSTALPDQAELSAILENQQIPCVFAADGKIAAALQYDQRGNVVTIKHVATAAAHRRHGLAKALRDFLFAKEAIPRKYLLWVDENNLPAVEFYKASGFSFDGRVTFQLLQE